MGAEQIELADRIRALLSADLDLEEKQMFGSRAFLVGGRSMAPGWKDVSPEGTTGDDDLMFWPDAARDQERA